MQKAKIIKGNNLLDFLLDLPSAFTLWSGKEQIDDLASFDLFKWYYISRLGNELHIAEVDFTESNDELKDHLLIDFK
jgi:hypothetical protein